jgi:hypothetical protein
MSKIDEVEAQRALEGLQLLGRGLDEELDAFASSRITPGGRPLDEPDAPSSAQAV